MTNCNCTLWDSTPASQANGGNQVPAHNAEIDTIEAQGNALEQIEPYCTGGYASSTRSHAAVRRTRAAITSAIRYPRWPLALIAGGLLALGWVALDASPPLLVYNASDSVPAGWYRITSPDSPAVGDLVLVLLPVDAATLAAQRGYLPTHVPLLKTVAAIPPQNVCVQGDQVLIDGQVVARRLHQDRQGRALPTWQACRRLAGDELFLLSTTNSASFDSRYFGPVSASVVIGRAQPLWLESRR